MKTFVEEKICEISRYVLSDEPDINQELYASRLRLLYFVILEEAHENETVYDFEEIIAQICSFETSQLYFTETSLEQYRNISTSTAIEVFSSAAYGLAVEHLKGNNYSDLAELLSIVYHSLIDKLNAEVDKVTISESLLDFSFANGSSEIMSLRLKRQWDAMR